MSRSVAWRRTPTDAVFWRQVQAINATMYILRETGPTGFLLKEEGEAKPFKVFLGDPHSCNCAVFRKERDLCKHICWLILKKFRVPQDNAVTWQLGLVEREINEILRGQLVKQSPRRRVVKKLLEKKVDGREMLQQRDIKEEDVCPICQDELLDKHLPVTYCKFGCGNSIHIKCMKIWADHQKSTGETVIKCPFCREDFGPIELLKKEMYNATGQQPEGGRMDRHIGTDCRSCHVSPIEGKCYRCALCPDFYLCKSCFNTPLHADHPFQFRQKRNQGWRNARRTYGAALPQAVVDSMLNRELTSSDYDTLLQLDSGATHQDIPENVIQSFPLEKVRANGALLQPGTQCRICLRGYQIGDFVRKLPNCKHKFHKDCIDSWLLHSKPTCPIDGTTVWDAHSEEQRSKRSTNSQTKKQDKVTNSFLLEVPGIGIARLQEEQNNQNNMVVGRQAHRNQRVRGHSNAEQLRHVPPGHLSLNGRAVGANTGHDENIDDDNFSESEDLPGHRLLARTLQNRETLNQRIVDLDSSRTQHSTVSTLTNIAMSPGAEDLSVDINTTCDGAQRNSDHSPNRSDPSYYGIMGDSRYNNILEQLYRDQEVQQRRRIAYDRQSENERGAENRRTEAASNRVCNDSRTRDVDDRGDVTVSSVLQTLQSSSNSAPPSVVSQPLSVVPVTSQHLDTEARGRRRGRTVNRAQPAETLRFRSTSRERTLVRNTNDQINRLQTQRQQDLYLGNNPQYHAPPRGDTNSGRPPRPSQLRLGLTQNAQLHNRNERTSDIALQGNKLENLTLRDLLK